MKKSFDQYKFILSACSKEQTRYFMQKPMYYPGLKSIVSTDGRRMHLWKLEEYEIVRFGLSDKHVYVDFAKIGKDYKVIAGDVIEEPINVERVIPENNAPIDGGIDLDINPDQTVPRFLINTQIPIALEYFKPLYGVAWEVSKHPDNPGSKAVIFKYQEFSAVIMPFMINV